MFIAISFITILFLNYRVVLSDAGDIASHQLEYFKNRTNDQPKVLLTTSNGAPVEYEEATISLNSDVIRNRFLLESLSHFDRERIPERVVHAKGAGAFGYFEVTKDISDICKAPLFSPVGKKTPIAVRFSLVAANLGGADTNRDTRGFAIKFYTEEGNFDIVGLNFAVFPIKDPLLFRTFVHSQKRNPVTNLQDTNMLWDFITLNPGSINVFLRVFSDYGTPAGWPYIPGFSVHTYETVNNEGEHRFIRFYLEPEAGIKNLNASEAQRVAGADPDSAVRGLYNAIASGDFPAWTVKIQVLTLEDVNNAKFDVFDITRELPVNDYPYETIGRLVLDRNPTNAFNDVEQIAFCPSNLVPGILGGPDKLFESRQFSYRDTQNYRLGANFDKIDVNYPYRSKVATYNRDGNPPTGDNDKGAPNYYPNSFNGPMPYTEGTEFKILSIIQDTSLNYDQSNDYYTNQLTSEERNNLIQNIVTSLSGAVDFLQERAIQYFDLINNDLASRVKQGLNLASRVKQGLNLNVQSTLIYNHCAVYN